MHNGITSSADSANVVPSSTEIDLQPEESASTLSALVSTGRIYAPIAYAPVRERQIVPVVHLEAMPLAAWFPIVWRGVGDQPKLVALRTLLESGEGQPIGSPRNLTSLPLISRAHPFKLARSPERVGDFTVALDRDLADVPTDAGAPILLARGKLSRGAELKLRALELYAKSLPETQAMTSFLHDRELLTKWPLEFELEGTVVTVEHLSIIQSEAFDDGRLAPLIDQFGPTGAKLLMAHRLSLFRAGVLVSACRAALKSRLEGART